MSNQDIIRGWIIEDLPPSPGLPSSPRLRRDLPSSDYRMAGKTARPNWNSLVARKCKSGSDLTASLAAAPVRSKTRLTTASLSPSGRGELGRWSLALPSACASYPSCVAVYPHDSEIATCSMPAAPSSHVVVLTKMEVFAEADRSTRLAAFPPKS